MELLQLWVFLVAAVALLMRGATCFESFRARLAVDYGPRIVGVATCDPFGNIKPFCTFANQGDLTRLSRQILDKARVDGAAEILVGLPLDSNGKMSHKVRNFNGQLCLNFSSVLSAVASVELPRARILLVDERYTTREAKARMKAERIRASLDAMSAACLLERYMDDKGEGALEPLACSYPPPKELEQFDYNVVKRYIRERYYDDAPHSLLDQKRKTMQKLKDGVVVGKHHLYFDNQVKRIVASSESSEAEIRALEADLSLEEGTGAGVGAGADDGNESDGEDWEGAEDVEGWGEVDLGLEGGLEVEVARAATGSRGRGTRGSQKKGDKDGDDPFGFDFDDDDEDDEEEDEEDDEDELAAMMRIKQARRKKGTLKKKI